ncbi:hypothetical protein BGZ80_002397 [Entomortierella chlamydospora]|uniref:Uncharacterized protein n=1 Tax=Entomortierella chlamydospora TaxID=101097 RepID=A0A9P6N192_9FUNG|nr:hypothetical protein BGZ80_002397 [Entomortierella chlamydospora]
MDSAIEVLTKNLENGGYFRQANPNDFDAEDFKGFDDKRRALSEVEDDNDETSNEIGDDTDDLSLPLFTDEDRKTLADTYLELPDNKVILPSGKVLEDVYFLRNVDDATIKDMFTPADWAFIMKEQEMPVSLSDQDVAKILERFRRVDSIGTIMSLLQERHPRFGKGSLWSETRPEMDIR